MADRVAFETEFLIALEGVMAIFTTQNAVQPCTLEVVGALTSQVPELLAIATFDCGVVKILEEVARRLLLELREEILVLLDVFRFGIVLGLGLVIGRDCFRDEALDA